jgi:hypothetical protein
MFVVRFMCVSRACLWRGAGNRSSAHLLCLGIILSRQNPSHLGTAAVGGRDDSGDSTFLEVVVVVAARRASPTVFVVHRVTSSPSAMGGVGRPTADSTTRTEVGRLRFGPESAPVEQRRVAAARVENRRAEDRQSRRRAPTPRGWTGNAMTRWCSSSSCSRRCLTTSPSRSPSPLPPSDPRGDSHRCRLLEARRPQRRCIPAGAYSCCTARPTGGAEVQGRDDGHARGAVSVRSQRQQTFFRRHIDF